MKTRNLNLILAALLSSFAGCAQDTPTESQTDLLSAMGLDGKVALVEFGIIGCEVSEAGLLKMQSMHQEKSIPGLAFLRVEESPENAESREYFDNKSLPFPVRYDPQHKTAKALQATTYPCLVLLDKFGRVRYRGSFPDDELSAWVAALNAEKNDPGPDVALFGALKLDMPKLLTETKLPSVSGKELKPLTDYAGKNGLMAIFVDTSCPFAGQIIKELPSVNKQLAKHNIPVVLINTDESAKVVKTFYPQIQGDVPVIYDTTASTHKKWDVHSVPTVFVINSSKTLVYKGAAVWFTIAAAIEKDLNLPADSISVVEKGTAYG